MAITWYWNHVLGYLHRKSGHPDDNRVYKAQIMGGGNCMAVLAVKANTDDNGKPYPKPVWTVYGEFWNDPRHLTNCLGITKVAHTKKLHNLYEDATKVCLNTFYWKEIQPIAKAFAKAQIKVELYYKEPKEKGDGK